METILPLLDFVVAATVTPGPNNLMVLVSGANFGLTRTLPHIAGIACGFPAMIIAAGLGLGVAFDTVPGLAVALKYAAFAYLLWLAWRMTQAGKPESSHVRPRPLSFLEAVAFQWVNPKAWSMLFSGVTLFASGTDHRLLAVGVMAGLFGLVCLPNGVAWTLFGAAISRWLTNDVWRTRFNWSMAALLVVSVLPSLL
jgi:threonine/homoserine/homoserine lactone efflux protein